MKSLNVQRQNKINNIYFFISYKTNKRKHKGLKHLTKYRSGCDK